MCVCVCVCVCGCMYVCVCVCVCVTWLKNVVATSLQTENHSVLHND